MKKIFIMVFFTILTNLAFGNNVHSAVKTFPNINNPVVNSDDLNGINWKDVLSQEPQICIYCATCDGLPVCISCYCLEVEKCRNYLYNTLTN